MNTRQLFWDVNLGYLPIAVCNWWLKHCSRVQPLRLTALTMFAWLCVVMHTCRSSLRPQDSSVSSSPWQIILAVWSSGKYTVCKACALKSPLLISVMDCEIQIWLRCEAGPKIRRSCSIWYLGAEFPTSCGIFHEAVVWQFAKNIFCQGFCTSGPAC